MAYDIIGNVVDKNNKGLKNVNVSDGITSVKTNEDGYYEIKTEKKELDFYLNGYDQAKYDLSKYKNPSSLNVDITLNLAPQVDNSKNQGTTKLNNYGKIILISGSVILIGILGFLAYKKFKK
jgi:N terminal of Calcineurin-like phosphoesterase